MELFKVERYGTEQSFSPDEQLQTLKAKIEERKKRLFQTINKPKLINEPENINEPEIISNLEEHTNLKKKKKTEDSNNNESAESKFNNNKVTDSLTKKKTKKCLNAVEIKKNQPNSLQRKSLNENEIANDVFTDNLNKDGNEDIPSPKSLQTGENNLNLIEGDFKVSNINCESFRTSDDQKLFPILGKQKHVKLLALKRTLPRWLSEPMVISASVDTEKVSVVDSLEYLSENTVNNLKMSGIEYLFPVQAAVIPYIHSQVKMLRFPPRDICVEAPTGSGKTLTYALPVIECLSHYIVKELYCLVVVPSKDLAIQVRQVFSTYTKGTNVKVGLICGAKTLEKERTKLVSKGPQGYMNMVEILIATPGRLVDHLKSTSGFSLKHLRFLVIDEADRLLSQNYSGWLEVVLASAHSLSYRTLHHHLTVQRFQKNFAPLQKFLFSATLTQNPEKLAPLKLLNPILFTSKLDHPKTTHLKNDGLVENAIETRFVVPKQLVEKMVVVKEELKPLVIVHLMLKLKYKRVLCFTKSVEATHRLHLLLQSIGGFTVAEFSSNLTETQRKGIIRDFKKGSIDVLISSDAMARGMDIDNVNLVVNYDSAANSKTYVHRVGRTARAGNRGEALTILTTKEVYHFKKMFKELSGVISKMKITDEELLIYENQYEKALSDLQEKIFSEKKLIKANSRRFKKV